MNIKVERDNLTVEFPDLLDLYKSYWVILRNPQARQEPKITKVQIEGVVITPNLAGGPEPFEVYYTYLPTQGMEPSYIGLKDVFQTKNEAIEKLYDVQVISNPEVKL